MLRQFIKLIINRNFKKNKFHTFLNILGLAVGLSAFILIMMFVQHERNYDRFHTHYEDIYRIICDDEGGKWSGTPAQLGGYLKERVPEILNYLRIEEREDIMVFHEEERFYEKDLIYSEKALFEVFDFRIIRGNQHAPLSDNNSIVITEEMAEKYFSKEDPIGKTLELTEKRKPYTVTAVVAEPPTNSSIRFNFIISFDVFDKDPQWGERNYTTYLQLDHKLEEQAEVKIREIAVERDDHTMKLDYVRLQPLKNMRFEPIRGNSFNTLNKKYIFIYFSAAFFVLLLAAINYTNLASAISIKRSKEVALKKISGSSRRRLIFEVLFESVMLSLLALFIALILVEVIRPFFDGAVQTRLHFDYSKLSFYILITVLVGAIAGLYPAVYSSGFNIMGLLKESLYKGKKGSQFRNILVLVQFGITSFLLICALTFSKQLEYLNNQDLGLNAKNVYALDVHWSGIKVEELKQHLKQDARIKNVTTSSFGAGVANWNQRACWEGSTEENERQMYVHSIDKDFFETLEVDIVEGKDHYKNFKRKDKLLYFINQSAKNHIGWEVSIGNAFSVYGKQAFGEVVGVAKDFKYRSLHHKVEPTAFILKNSAIPERMLIRLNPGETKEAYDLIKSHWNDFAPPNAPFLLSSLEKDFENLYGAEERTKKIIGYFTGIALIISFLGLLGLATYISLQRTKEIGIRKVIGATEKGLMQMLVSAFLKWVVIAFIIAAPLSYIYMTSWLNNFAYHINMSPGIFITAGLFALGVGFFSVIFQAYRAVSTKPVNSLRYE